MDRTQQGLYINALLRSTKDQNAKTKIDVDERVVIFGGNVDRHYRCRGGFLRQLLDSWVLNFAVMWTSIK